MRDKFYLFIPDEKQVIGFDVRVEFGRDVSREVFKRLRVEHPRMFAMHREQLEHFFFGNAIPDTALPGPADKVN